MLDSSRVLVYEGWAWMERPNLTSFSLLEPLLTLEKSLKLSVHGLLHLWNETMTYLIGTKWWPQTAGLKHVELSVGCDYDAAQETWPLSPRKVASVRLNDENRTFQRPFCESCSFILKEAQLRHICSVSMVTWVAEKWLKKLLFLICDFEKLPRFFCLSFSIWGIIIPAQNGRED